MKYIRFMKTAFVPATAFALALALTACSEKKEAAPATAGQKTETGGSLISAPTDYLQAAAKAKQNAVKTIDTTAINSAIDQFNVAEGRYPKDLNELVSKKYMSEIPATPFGTKLQYDATAGQVKIVKE